jgi:hypothetical protein
VVTYAVVLALALLTPADRRRDCEAMDSVPKDTAYHHVLDIQAHCDSIDSHLEAARRVERDVSGQSTEGGHIVAWFDGATLVKLTATLYGESGRSPETFYFSRGALIYARVVTERYDQRFSGRVSARFTDGYFYLAPFSVLRTHRRDGDVSADDDLGSSAEDVREMAESLAECARARDSDERACSGS